MISLQPLLFCAMAVMAGSIAAAEPKSKPAAPTRPPDAVDLMAASLKPSRVVVYKKVSNRELHLHVFEPAGFKPLDKRACFITIHGGGWVNGEPSRMYPFAAHFAERGMVGISVEYRLLKGESGVTVFDCVKDGRSALRYVRAHAAEFGIDPQKIVVQGGSAGGHVAVGTALFEGVDEAGEDASVSCVPNAMVLLFPVIDTSTNGYGNAKLGARWQELSPVHHVRAGLPPTILFHGTGDTTTPFKGAQAFHDAMLKAGNRCDFVVTEGAQHGYLMRTRPLYDEAERKTDEFLVSLGFLAGTPVAPVER